LKAFVEGIEAEDGQEAQLRWAHIDMAGTMEVGSVNLYLIPRIVLSVYLVFQGHETDTIFGEGNDRSSRAVGGIYT